jgi:hypothetical protein
MTWAGVIGMTMGNDGPIDGADRVDKKVARRAIESLRAGTDQILGPQAHGFAALKP